MTRDRTPDETDRDRRRRRLETQLKANLSRRKAAVRGKANDLPPAANALEPEDPPAG